MTQAQAKFPIPLTHFEEFRKMWREADHAGKKQFTFYGHEVLTSYAKYVVEYEEPYAIAGGYIKK